VVADRRPEARAREELRVGREEVRVVVLPVAVRIDEVAEAEREIGRGQETRHLLRELELRQRARPRIAPRQEAERRATLLGRRGAEARALREHGRVGGELVRIARLGPQVRELEDVLRAERRALVVPRRADVLAEAQCHRARSARPAHERDRARARALQVRPAGERGRYAHPRPGEQDDDETERPEAVVHAPFAAPGRETREFPGRTLDRRSGCDPGVPEGRR
jgi:hypothetical protein